MPTGKSGGGIGVAASITVITLGGILVYSALTGQSIVDVVSGQGHNPLNPKGGGNLNVDGSSTGTLAEGGKWTPPAGGAASFKGPHSALLDNLAGVAQNRYHLTITATTNGVHAAGLFSHAAGRAFDSAGTEADMHGFAQYVHDNYLGTIGQLIHNPGFAVNNGMDVSPLFFAGVWADHRNHVHLSM